MLRIPHLLAPLALMGLAAAPAAAQTDIGNLSPEERSAFRAEVRSYLLEHPDVIVEAIQLLEQRRAEAAVETDRKLIAEHAEELFNDDFSYVAGNPEGDVTVVEFLDYRCPYCKQAQPEVARLLEDDPNVRLVVKEYPILGPDSVAAARMALAALELDREKFGDLHERLMTYDGQLSEQAAYRIAEDLGYDPEELREAAADPEIEKRIQRNYALAAKLGIQGTPGFVIGDQIVRGFVPFDELSAAVEQERAQASN